MEDNLPGEHYQTQIIDDHKSWTSILKIFRRLLEVIPRFMVGIGKINTRGSNMPVWSCKIPS